MAADQLANALKKRKKKLEWGAIALVAVGLLVLTLVQREVLDLGPGLTDSQGVVTLVSINFSVVMMALLITLILRNLYRIFFERQTYGSLRTKMVVAFICLSLAPTIMIFYYSYRLIVSGHNLWFSPKIEAALSDSLQLTEAALAWDDRLLSAYGRDLLDDLEKRRLALAPTPELQAFLEEARRKFHLSAVEYYDAAGRPRARAGGEDSPPVKPAWFAGQFDRLPPWTEVLKLDQGDLTRLVWPLPPPALNRPARAAGYFAVSRLTPAPIRSRMEAVRQGLLGYQDALNVQRPFRVTQLAALAGVALLAVFISVWIGSHLAGSLAGPVMELVEGTKKVAAGDLDVTLVAGKRADELADLVESFNQMTRELKASYAELDQRRRFVETVLENVSTGVMVIGVGGEVHGLNRAALEILGLPGPVGHLADLPPALSALSELTTAEARRPGSGRRAMESALRLTIDGVHRSLMVHTARLRAEEGVSPGFLMAFDDLTELEKVQRLSAWREVARRIAHEVKNPLTPIQLSAQRLRRRFGQRLAGQEDGGIFDECTGVIIRQVEEMKKLVDEFSSFARLPETRPQPGDFAALVEESLVLFRQAHKKVRFDLDIKNRPPIFNFDPEQMRRVVTNLLDNAVAAMNGQGDVSITLEMDDPAGLRLTVLDSGPGLPPALESRIFEPYVSTKEGGQGLGLAIIKTIVNDHGGFIRARNTPRGASFVIDLPMRC